MPQPSAQGIASLYMGNPAALQQKVQKEQQAKPGLPPDLKNLMALNIVTNEQDAAKRQAAMNALNQMAPAGQEPPTIAQSIQQQAKQKLQAQMLQQQRQQQGLQALAKQSPSMEVPENVPQPETQPQGIDELPVDMEFAGGGIVGYSNGTEVRNPEVEKILAKPPHARTPEDNARLEQAGIVLRRQEVPAGSAVAQINTLLGGLGSALREKFTGGASRLSTEELANRPAAGGALNERILRALGAEQSVPMAETPPQASYSNEARRTPAPAQARPIADLRAAAEQSAPRPRPAPSAPAAAPVAQAPAAPVARSLADLVGEREAMAAKSRDAEMERYGKLMPRPDMSQYDRLMAELEARKKQFEGPKAGFDAFAELMGQIAAAGPRRTSGEAGAAGVAGLSALRKERQAQQFELTKQAIDIAQRKIDADRAYNKELYATGEAAAKRTADIAKETAQEMGLNQRQTALLANQIKVQELQNKGMLASANVRAAAGGGEDRQRLNELKALQTSLKDQLKDPRMMGPSGDPIRSQLARVNAAIAQMAGLDTMAGAPGAGSPGGTTRLRFDAQGNPIK